MAALDAGYGAAGGPDEGSARHIVFFDVETNVPGPLCRSYELLEFGAVVLDARGLGELGSFHTLIRPNDLSCINRRTTECNSITSATVADAPDFADVAADVYKVLHGHIWAGHNILRFDILRVNEAFSKIGQQAPQPFGVIDTYPLLRKTFGKRAGNYKLETLAGFCGFGKQEHRSIADVRMNINVLRSCAAVLFLESNYPDIFVPQMKVSVCTSASEQSATLSSPYRLTTDDYAEQEVDSGLRMPDKAAEPSSFSRPCHPQSESHVSHEVNGSPKLSEVTDLLRTTRLSPGVEEVKENLSGNGRKESTHGSSSRNAKEGERWVSSSCMKASSGISKTELVQEDLLEPINGSIRVVAEVMDNTEFFTAESCMESSDREDARLCEGSIHKAPINSSESRGECGVSRTGDPEPEGVSFLVASQVSLSSIEIGAGPPSFSYSKVLLHKGVPLHLLELEIRVRFTINLSYAFDENGKPRFSILVEPSDSACNVISVCEEALRSVSASDGEVGWVPALRKESGRWAARLSIGTRWGGSYSIYTTEFFRRTPAGREALSLGRVDAARFKSAIPHGCLIDAGFGLRAFNIDNRLAGVKLVAKHITVM